MSKLGKTLFAGVILGAAGAAVYSFVKKYNDLAPVKTIVPEDNEKTDETPVRAYTSIDMDAAKEAAAETFDSIKNGAVKAWDVAKKSAKDVYNNVMESYGDDIEVVKGKANTTFDEVKEKAVNIYGEVKDKATNVYGEVKDKAANVYGDVKDQAVKTWGEVKDGVTDKVNTFMVNNPQVQEAYDQVKGTVTSALESVKESFSNFKEDLKTCVNEADEATDEDVLEGCDCDIQPEGEEEKSQVDQVIEEMEKKAEDFVQNL